VVYGEIFGRQGGAATTAQIQDLLDFQGPPLSLEQMDPALFAEP